MQSVSRNEVKVEFKALWLYWDEYTCSILSLYGQTLRLAANNTAD